MKLVEALEILRSPLPDDARRSRVALACGFTPLHLETFLAAELRRAVPESRVEISTGLFDDLLGTVRGFAEGDHDAVAIVVEWSDIDPRLGLRRLGGWRVDDIDDVVRSASEFLNLLRDLVTRIPTDKRVVCCFPTLPIPPIFPGRRAGSGAHELRLRSLVASLASQLEADRGVRTVSTQTLDERSIPSLRRDVGSELATGFPYSLAHASAVAELLGALVVGATPRKGLITDLDDTLWAGLAGEVGPANVSWSLDASSQGHGLYQQLLASLASAGVLIAAASKNDPMIVDEVFSRADILLPSDAVYPIVADWQPKSSAVRTILAAWNIAPDDVVFVDDSPMELAEVRSVFPQLETLLFSPETADVWALLGRLRDLFGKDAVLPEDRLRLASIRAAGELATAAAPASLDDFLRSAEGRIEFSWGTAGDERALELINKTNQFNLNGRRLTEAALAELLRAPSAFLLVAGYEDRFGPLGKIAAVVGHVSKGEPVLDAWVMSCRAFSRRIEHETLSYLFERLGADEIALSYAPTDRNGPIQDFLVSLTGSEPQGPSVSLTREMFSRHAPLLVHSSSDVAR